MVGKKKKALRAKALLTLAGKQHSKVARRGKEDRRAAKLERRRKEKRTYTAEAWAEPAPQHLVAKLDLPKHNSKYQSYFEFAENKEKKKKLEFQVTNDPNPPPGFAYVPIGDPTITNACKELSREQDAMIFIVSRSKEDNSKISDHMFRTGYHFREVIVDEARKIVGDTVISNATQGLIEPIPESQAEINKQADGAIRDLFPRIPNTDRQMIIEHAFQKGVKFHGEPTVGLQADLPLSRRVQLAVLAHIRHTHTRYDKLLKETSWINARKVVEPVCLDVLVKWRGDEETGRDQMDEILREVVIITDSEDEDDSSDDEDTDDDDEEEEEVTSAESAGRISASIPNGLQRQQIIPMEQSSHVDKPGPSRYRIEPREGVRRPQPRFKRYQAAWDEALSRQRNEAQRPEESDIYSHEASMRSLQPNALPLPRDVSRQVPILVSRPPMGSEYIYREIQPHYDVSSDQDRQTRYRLQERPPSRTLIRRDEVTVRTLSDRSAYHAPPRHSTPAYVSREPRPQVVVRASPTRSGLQDMLVPSIETSQNDGMNAPPRIDRSTGVSDLRPYQDSYQRQVIDRFEPPSGYREVILIENENPQPKRRRVLEDDYGRFRPLPREQESFAAPYHDSIPPPFSSRDADRRPIAHPRPAQGLSTNMPLSSVRPAHPERAHVYEVPNSIPVEMHSSHYPRRETETNINGPAPSLRREIASPHPQINSHEGYNPQRVVSENMRVAEPDHVIRRGNVEPALRHYLPRPASPTFPISNSVSRSYGTDGPANADRTFIQRFSQSRPEPSLSQTQNIPSSYERIPQNVVRSDYVANQPARSFAPVRPVQAPVRYLERPESYREGEHQSVYIERRDPYVHAADRQVFNPAPRESVPPGANMPMYPRVMPPRRQVIVLD